MKRTKSRINKKLAAPLIIVLVFLAITALQVLGTFDFLEYKTYDLWVRLLARHSRPLDDIVVVLLDQDSIDWAQQERRWSWPWPRRAYGELLDYMNLSGAKTVACDVIYSEPSVYRSRRDIFSEDGMNEDDAAFVRAEQNYGKAVQAVFFSTQAGRARSWPAELDKHVFKPENFGAFLPVFGLKTEDESRIGAQFPIPGLRNAAGALGNFTGEADSDGVLRRLRLFTLFDGKAVPGLSAAALIASGDSSGTSASSAASGSRPGSGSIRAAISASGGASGGRLSSGASS
jgi:adenylate cyclase